MSTLLRNARNLGPASEAELNSIGYSSLEQLIDDGWEEVFIRLVELHPHRLNLNMATALIGAIENCDWRDVPAPLKAEAKTLIQRIKRG